MDIEQVGAVSMDMKWEKFYSIHNNDSSPVKFVKTHKYPRDSFRAIYVYRDPRLSINSYLKFKASFLEVVENNKNILDLIVGNDYYGNWTNHYHKWNNREGLNFTVAYEDLVSPTEELIFRLGEFISLSPVNSKFINPMQDLKKINPDFFRHGLTTFKGYTTDWSPKFDLMLKYVHGKLMNKLNYLSNELLIESLDLLDDHTKFLLDSSVELSNRCTELQFHCDERLRIIKQMTSDL